MAFSCTYSPFILNVISDTVKCLLILFVHRGPQMYLRVALCIYPTENCIASLICDFMSPDAFRKLCQHFLNVGSITLASSATPNPHACVNVPTMSCTSLILFSVFFLSVLQSGYFSTNIPSGPIVLFLFQQSFILCVCKSINCY